MSHLPFCFKILLALFIIISYTLYTNNHMQIYCKLLQILLQMILINNQCFLLIFLFVYFGVKYSRKKQNAQNAHREFYSLYRISLERVSIEKRNI